MNTKEIAELDLGSLLQFDLLKKVIDHFLKEQKSLSHKVSYLEEKVKKDNIKSAKALTSLQSQISQLSPHATKEEHQPPQLEGQPPIQEGLSSIPSSSLSPLNKIDNSKGLNEHLLSETESLNLNRPSPKKDTHPSSLLDNPQIEEMEKRLTDLTQVVEDLKVKVGEFNLFDTFKESGEGDEKVEIDLVLLKALENKVNSKFAQFEDKLKVTDQSLVKLKVDFSNTTNKSDSGYRTAFQQKEQLEKYINDNNQAMEDMDTKLMVMTRESTEEMTKLILQTKVDLIKEMDEKAAPIKSITTARTSKVKETYLIPSVPQEVLNEMQNELKLMINKAISDSEKYVKGLISELAVDSIRKDVSSLQKTLGAKLEKKDLQDLFLKFDESKSEFAGIKEELENVKGNSKNNAQSIEKLCKRSEFLTNLIYSKQPVNSDSASSSKMPAMSIDFAKYTTQTQLNQLQTSLQCDHNKLALKVDDLKKAFEAASDHHKFFASEKDLRNMEQCFMNEMDEYKLHAMKKFSDKLETQKSFRFIDMQIRHLAGSFSKKDKGGNKENWLLAKRPVGMYQCASCESVIGDLNAKSDFVPWNRLQSREEAKKYRMGHGFSKMLQMVNSDLLRTAEVAKEPHSDGEPTDESNSNFSHLNHKEDKVNPNLSVANIPNLPKILQANYLDISQDLNANEVAAVEGNEELINDEMAKEPKVVKIYRKLKKEDTQSLGIRGSHSRKER